MAGERFGRATFPGIQQVVSATYTLSHGVLPSFAQLVIAPQRDFEAEIGDLILFDGAGTVRIPGCRIDRHSFELNPSGYVWRLTMLDRRWKWQFGSISGSYNARDAQGALLLRTQKTPRELALLCAEAAGEAGLNVEALPNHERLRPAVDWNGDTPMECLANLAETFGCRLVYDVISDTVKLAKEGEGALLPDGPITDDSLGLELPGRPDALVMQCGPTIFDACLHLEAVGLDRDKRIKPIDELSYRPAGGWSGCFPPYFGQIPEVVPPPGENPVLDSDKDLAKQSVYRWYRVTAKDPYDQALPLNVPGYGVVRHRTQILPIGNAKVDVTIGAGVAEAEGEHIPEPATVNGVYWEGKASVYGLEQNSPRKDYRGGFSINRGDGIVEFSDYVFKRLPGALIGPADLRLLTGVSVKDFTTNSLARHGRTLELGPPFYGTLPKVVKRDDLHLAHRVAFDEQYIPIPDTVQSNLEELDEAADFYLHAHARQYEVDMPRTIGYGGIIPIQLDGAIQQVTWTIGGGAPCTTRASRNDEHSLIVPPYKERRVLEGQRRLRDSVTVGGGLVTMSTLYGGGVGGGPSTHTLGGGGVGGGPSTHTLGGGGVGGQR